MSYEEKVKAARTAQGMIDLEEDSAEQVKEAINKVSRITSTEDNRVHFKGQRIIEGHGFNLEVNCFDVFECPNGYLLHTYMVDGSNWAVAGKTINQMLSRAPDQRVAKRAHGLMVQKGLASMHSH